MEVRGVAEGVQMDGRGRAVREGGGIKGCRSCRLQRRREKCRRQPKI